MTEIFRHAAFPVYAKNLKAGAAVGAADGAGIAMIAVDIGVDANAVAFFKAFGIKGGVFGNAEDFAAELMADDAGIADEAVGAAEGADIAAADRGGMDFDQGFALLGFRHRLIDAGNFPGFSELDSFHGKQISFTKK